MTSASSSDVSGVCGAGFKTVVQPAAIAGATLCATKFSGKLNGVMARIGPSAKRRTIPARPAVEACQSSGSHSPPMRVASSAATANVKIARSTSARAARMGFPASSAIRSPNSSRRVVIPSEMARRMAWRSYVGSSGAIGCADYGVVIRSQNLEALAFGEPFAVEIEAPGSHWCFCCGAHEWSLNYAWRGAVSTCDSATIASEASKTFSPSSNCSVVITNGTSTRSTLP
jgi:hypothetical protein